MLEYLDLLRDIMNNGTYRPDRTGTGTRSVFSRTLKFNLSEGFPLLTTKRLHFKSILYELLWFIKGDTNIKFLTDNGVTIWNEWADADGNLGPVYGSQWRSWKTPDGGVIDQLMQVQNSIRKDPYGRRHIVSAWNPSDIPSMKLPPCHMIFQFYVDRDKLSCLMYQRSADSFLGVPYNIASYALLTCMMAQTTGYNPGELTIVLGDAHIYSNHFEQVQEQLSRDLVYDLPRIELNPFRTCITDFTADDVTLVNYKAHPSIKAQIAV